MEQIFKIEHDRLTPIRYQEVENAICHYLNGITVESIDITIINSCYWRKWTDHDGDIIWSTSCKNEHKFFHDGPKENKYTNCPYCGKPIEITAGLSQSMGR